MTGLTVPVSRADPGRAARPGPMPTAGIEAAGAAADFGDVMFRVGTAVETDRLDREMQRLRVTAMRDVGQLRGEVGAIADPDAAERAWSDGLAALRERYATPDETGRPALDPKNADRFAPVFDEIATLHAVPLGRRLVGARQAQRVEFERERRAAATEAYATAPDEISAAEVADWFFQGIGGEDDPTEFFPDLHRDRIMDEWQDEAETARAGAALAADDAEFYAAPDPDEAARIDALIAGDDEIARLAAILHYTPDSPDAVARFGDYLWEIENASPAEKRDYVNAILADEAARIRSGAERPMFHPGGEITEETLQEAARRTIAAHRDGRIDEETYARQARLLRWLMVVDYD